MSPPCDLAVLGLGAMGRRMAVNAAAAGHAVTVWNRSEAATWQLVADHPGLTGSASAADAAGAARIVVATVTDDDASRGVWLGRGALDALDTDGVAVDASTLSPGWTATLAQRVSATGSSFLAAPVLGSTPQAEAGQLVQLVGGPADALDTVRPLLETSASTIVHVGRPQDAAVRKLVVNGWLAGQVALAGELVAQLERTGQSRSDAAGFLEGLPLTSPALAGVLQRMAVDEAAPRFPIRLVAKDVRYLRDAAGERELLTALSRAWSAAAERDGDLDIAGYIRSVPVGGP